MIKIITKSETGERGGKVVDRHVEIASKNEAREGERKIVHRMS